MTDLQYIWLNGLSDPLFEGNFRMHGPTAIACERQGWIKWDQMAPTRWGWRLTHAGEDALEKRKKRLPIPEDSEARN